MKIVIFTHPPFLGSASMPLFTDMIARGTAEHGHQVEQWTPKAFFHRLPAPRGVKKWLGYLDQFLVFPVQVRSGLRNMARSTLFVFADQALGPWVPLVAGRPHVIHCHDFLALRSALGEFPQNPVSWTGRLYQRWIRRGFSSGRNFISVSARTREDLHRLLERAKPALSVVVHNGLNHPYKPLPQDAARSRLESLGLSYPDEGFILHVGGNQWYKNRDGVLAIYAAYAQRNDNPLPLLMLGGEQTAGLRAAAARVPSPGRVDFLVRPPVEALEAAYSAASVLLFPSHAEGFGWPILEAMASGCPVLTTNDAPMTEVGGDVAAYLPAAPLADRRAWAEDCAARLANLLSRPPDERQRVREAGIVRAQSFTASAAMQRYIDIYKQVLEAADG